MLIVPHFVLPLSYFQGNDGAQALSECSVLYHMEFFLGFVTIIAGTFSFKYKNALYLIFPLAVVTFIHALTLQPVSYYIQSADPLRVWGQKVSLGQHLWIEKTIASLALVMCIPLLFSFFKKSKRNVTVLSPLRISYANTGKRVFRSVSLILSISIVTGVFFAYLLLNKSIESALELGAGRLGADLMIVPKGKLKDGETVLLSGGPTMFYMEENILDGIRDIEGVEQASPQLYLQPFSYLVCCTMENFLIIAYDPDTDFTITPWIQYYIKESPGEDEIVIGNLVKFYPGQKLEIFGRNFEITAGLDSTGLGYFDNSAFITLEYARHILKNLTGKDIDNELRRRKKVRDMSFSHMFASEEEEAMPIAEIEPDGVSSIFVKTADNASINKVSEKIEERFPNIDVIEVRKSTATVKRRIMSITGSFILPVLVLIFMGTTILSMIFSMIVNERQREIGLFRAMGAKKSDMSRIIIYELLMITLTGGIFGVILGSTLIMFFKNTIMSALELLYIWPSFKTVTGVLFFSLVLSLFIGLCAGIYPAFKAAGMEPYRAIRQGE